MFAVSSGPYFGRAADSRRDMRDDYSFDSISQQMRDAAYCLDAVERMPAGSMIRFDKGNNRVSYSTAWRS